MPSDPVEPLSESEAALFAALSAIIRTIPPGRYRAMLGGILEEHRAHFIQDGRAQAAALVSMLGSYAEKGEA